MAPRETDRAGIGLGQRQTRAVAKANAASPYFCLVSERMADGSAHPYRYGRLNLRFPASAITPDGRTRRLIYRAEAPGEQPAVVANCTIPATPKAVYVTYRLLYIDGRARVEGGDRHGDGAILQSCPATGCVLEPLVVVAPPPTSTGGSTTPNTCWNGFGCEGSAMQWYGEGSDYDPGWEDEVFVQADDEGACPQCGEKDPSEAQVESIEAAIELVQCESMKTVLRERLPYMQVFTEQPPAHAHPDDPEKLLGTHADGVIYLWEGLWKDDGATPRSQTQFVHTLVHEAAHAWWSYYQGYFDGKSTHHEPWTQTMASCGYTVNP